MNGAVCVRWKLEPHTSEPRHANATIPIINYSFPNSRTPVLSRTSRPLWSVHVSCVTCTTHLQLRYEIAQQQSLCSTVENRFCARACFFKFIYFVFFFFTYLFVCSLSRSRLWLIIHLACHPAVAGSKRTARCRGTAATRSRPRRRRRRPRRRSSSPPRPRRPRRRRRRSRRRCRRSPPRSLGRPTRPRRCRRCRWTRPAAVIRCSPRTTPSRPRRRPPSRCSRSRPPAPRAAVPGPEYGRSSSLPRSRRPTPPAQSRRTRTTAAGNFAECLEIFDRVEIRLNLSRDREICKNTHIGFRENRKKLLLVKIFFKNVIVLHTTMCFNAQKNVDTF